MEKIQLTKYTGNDTTLIVPGKINGKKVYSIGSNKVTLVTNENGAFISPTNTTNILGDLNIDYSLENVNIGTSKASFKSVIISEGIEKIEAFAFSYIEDLTNIIFSKSINYIEHMAFSGISIVYLEIPEQIIYLGKNVFMNNLNLKKVVYNAINAESGYFKVDGLKFSSSPVFYGVALEEIVIGSKVQVLPNGLFLDSVSLEEVIFGDKIKIIPGYLLYNSKNTFKYKSIVIPDSVEIIGKNSFRKNKNLETITISSGIKDIGTKVFYESSLVNIIFKGSESELLKIKQKATDSGLNDPFINAGVVYE